MDPLIKSQLLYQLSYTPIGTRVARTGAGLLGHLERIVQPENSSRFQRPHSQAAPRTPELSPWSAGRMGVRK